jgi:hypothetical protein
MRHVHEFYTKHHKHCVACLSLVAIVTHYVFPEYDVHVAALVGFICVECA